MTRFDVEVKERERIQPIVVAAMKRLPGSLLSPPLKMSDLFIVFFHELINTDETGPMFGRKIVW